MITERIDNITRIPEHYLTDTPPAPKSVKIEITGRCNYRCKFCALSSREVQPTVDMDFNLFKRITMEMRESGVEEIGVFYIGESFINPKLLVQCIEHLKSVVKMPYVFLTSNASLAHPKIVEECMKAGLDSLKWSINAGDEKQFSGVMGLPGTVMNKVRENIKGAWDVRKAGRYKTGLYASSIKYDDAQPERMKDLLENHIIPYVDQHYWLPLYSMGTFATEREKELGYTPTAGNQGRLDALRSPLPCWAVFTEGHVTSDGKLSACCFDAKDTWTMGDLNTTPFIEAWRSKVFQTLRKAHLAKDVTGTPCAECVAYAK